MVLDGSRVLSGLFFSTYIEDGAGALSPTAQIAWGWGGTPGASKGASRCRQMGLALNSELFPISFTRLLNELVSAYSWKPFCLPWLLNIMATRAADQELISGRRGGISGVKYIKIYGKIEILDFRYFWSGDRLKMLF